MARARRAQHQIVPQYGWGDEEFASVMQRILSLAKSGKVTDINSPPGTKKTLNTVRFMVRNRRPAVMSFPNHQNQATALEYILRAHEERRTRRLKQYVLDYAGVEQYCIFFRPVLLRALLSRWKRDGASWSDAVEEMLGSDEMFRLFLARGGPSENIIEFWEEIGRALDELEETGRLDVFARRVSEAVAARGQDFVCRNACPIGVLLASRRREVYRVLSSPRIITWRRTELYESKYPRASRWLLRANPEEAVLSFDELVEGGGDVSKLLCPRPLLTWQLTYNEKAGRPVFLTVRNSIVLVPHAGLDFVWAVVQRQHTIYGVPSRHTLYVDEYDALLRPARWPLVSLAEIEHIAGFAERLAGMEGQSFEGVHVDSYLATYAGYVHEALSRVSRAVRSALETGTYHPLATVTVEGAFAPLAERSLKVKGGPVVYRPLGARPVHIKHFLSQTPELFAMLLNPMPAFEEHRQLDPEWRTELARARRQFWKLARGATLKVRVPRVTVANGTVILELGSEKLRPRNVLSLLRSFVRPLLMTPVYAVYYTLSLGERAASVAVESIDVPVQRLIAYARRAVLTSATPIMWDVLVMGSNPREQVQSDYVALARDVRHSVMVFVRGERKVYADREEQYYTALYRVYRREYARELRRGLSRWAPPAPGKGDIRRVETEIVQMSPRTENVMQYSRLMSVRLLMSLESPARQIAAGLAGSAVEALESYLLVLGGLLSRGRTVLVLTQNRAIARAIASIAGAEPCSDSRCTSRSGKVAFYRGKRLAVTWFRSRASRGVDIPLEFDTVLVIGSPYPRPTTIVHTHRPDPAVGVSPHRIRLLISEYPSGVHRPAYLTLLPRDFHMGVNELVQAVGRAVRSAMRSGRRVLVLLPGYTGRRVLAFSPPWFRRALL